MVVNMNNVFYSKALPDQLVFKHTGEYVNMNEP